MKWKIQNAIDAIDKIFGDTSVPPQVTLEALEEIQDNLESKIGCLKNDIRDAGLD
jgi:hypothetical protein